MPDETLGGATARFPHDWQNRVVAEKEQLDERLEKLAAMVRTDTFRALDDEDRYLLFRQHTTMTELSKILGRRIERFTK